MVKGNYENLYELSVIKTNIISRRGLQRDASAFRLNTKGIILKSSHLINQFLDKQRGR